MCSTQCSCDLYTQRREHGATAHDTFHARTNAIMCRLNEARQAPQGKAPTLYAPHALATLSRSGSDFYNGPRSTAQETSAGCETWLRMRLGRLPGFWHKIDQSCIQVLVDRGALSVRRSNRSERRFPDHQRLVEDHGAFCDPAACRRGTTLRRPLATGTGEAERLCLALRVRRVGGYLNCIRSRPFEHETDS